MNKQKLDRAKKIEDDKKKGRSEYNGKKNEKNKNRRGNLSKVRT